jgi:hypothetical protein
VNAYAREKEPDLFTKHPFCCFCGGTTKAEEKDHVPGRAFFRDRLWPDGFVFPACTKCNRATADDETIAAWLARIKPEAENSKTYEEFKKKTEAHFRYNPGLLQSLNAKTTHRQRREARKALNLPPDYPLLEVPVISVEDDRVQNAILGVGRKLALALYYMHTGSSVPRGGGVAVRWYSNYQINNNEIPRDFAKVLPFGGKVMNGKTDLRNQFSYGYGIVESPEQKMMTFLALFHESFGILAFMSSKIEKLQPENRGDKMTLFTPYDWTTEAGA